MAWAQANLTDGAVGTVLAAIGTGLPEVLIAAVALVHFGGAPPHEQIGVGAILGAPFTLGTARRMACWASWR